MHHTAPRLSTAAQIRACLESTGDFDGRLVAANAVWETLSDPTFAGSRRVRNAIIDSINAAQMKDRRETRLDLPREVTFERCTFFGDAEFSRCRFENGIRLIDCTAEGRLSFRECEFAGPLFLDGIDVQGDFLIEDTLLREPPDVLNSSFRADASFINPRPLESNSWGMPIWQVPACEFSGRLIMDGYCEHVLPSFHRCRFQAESFVQLSWSADPVVCEFDGCRIAGRLILYIDGEARGDDRYDRRQGSRVIIRGCTVEGVVDLHQLRMKYFDLRDTMIVGGNLWVERAGLSNRLHGWDWIRAWSAADRVGVLRDEQRYRAPDDPELINPYEWPLDARSAGSLRSVATQYEHLRNSLRTLPCTDWEEDFCHYKCMDYRRRYAVARLGIRSEEENDYPASRGRWHFSANLAFVLGILACLLSHAFSSGIAVTTALACMSIAFCALWIFYARAYRLPLVTVFTVLKATIDLVVLKWMLAYGTRARRILGWAAAFILGFALCGYWPIVAWAPSETPVVSGIHDSDGVSITMYRPAPDGPPCPAPDRVVVGRLMYFSAVTYTTLGYGDYHPVGWVKPIAAIEAFLGAVTIALVTVVFARRFIR